MVLLPGSLSGMFIAASIIFIPLQLVLIASSSFCLGYDFLFATRPPKWVLNIGSPSSFLFVQLLDMCTLDMSCKQFGTSVLSASAFYLMSERSRPHLAAITGTYSSAIGTCIHVHVGFVAFAKGGLWHTRLVLSFCSMCCNIRPYT